MKIKKSPLILKDYFVLDFQYTFHQPTEEINREEVFDSYLIDFDFMTKTDEDGETLLFTKIGINFSEKPTVGYSILVESLTVLDVNSEFKLTPKEKGDLIYFSGLSMAINNLRHFIANMTSYSPMGKYTLPSVDLNAIHQEKMKELEKEKNLKKKKK
jgi:hypothetical protein